jgi:hypothetical protein
MIVIKRTGPDNKDFQALVKELDKELGYKKRFLKQAKYYREQQNCMRSINT